MFPGLRASGVLRACILAPAGLLLSGTSPTTHVISIENVQFSPQELTVKRGDHVVWVNKDLFPHTATASAHAFDSRSIAANASWTFAARTPGEYAYACTFHPTMKGKLTVK
jgi:plastocyanin